MADLFNFTTQSIPSQANETKSFGVKSANKFRITSSFDLTTNVPVYSMFKGTILLQQQDSNPNKVNLILRPIENLLFRVSVKYVIYRGLNILDFLTSNNITNSSTIVKTSGTELLGVLQSIQQNRAPSDDIPVEALFGNDLSPANTKNIDEFFFYNTSPSSQLFTIEGGVELGNFGAGEVGIEIVLNNPEYFIDVEIAKKSFLEFDVTGITNSLEKKWQREQMRHYVDVPAFFGLHHDIEEGIQYRDGSGDKQIASTIVSVYDNLMVPFATKNKTYLDIRNENGYSYNFYDNYVGTGGNANSELKTGADSGSLAFKEYYNNEWPLHIIDVITPSTTEDFNNFSLALRVNDNEKPLIAGYKGVLSQSEAPDEDQQIKFIDESFLFPQPVPNPLPDFTEPIELTVPNYLSKNSGTEVAFLVRLDYIKQIRLQDENDVFPQESPSDHLFGPISTEIPWNSADKVQWITSHHFKYFDNVNNGFAYGVTEENITAINPSLKTIKIGIDVVGQIPNTVEITNTSIQANVGIYNVIKVENTGTNETTITVRETLNTLQTGDKLKFNIEVAVSINYPKKEVLAENIDLSSVIAFDTGKKLWLYTKTGDVPKRYSISSRSFSSGDTLFVVSEAIDKEGYGASMQVGMVAESDATNGDRVLFYAAPRYYFKKTGVKDNNFFNYKGAVHNEDSFLKTLQKRLPDFKIEKYSLQTQPSQFTATLAYPNDTVEKENILFLGLSQTELDSLKTAANSQLSPYHLQMIKLVPQGNRQYDEDYESYYEFHVVVSGLDANGDYLEAAPSSLIKVYSRDLMVFTSEEFASSQELYSFQLNIEEKFYLEEKYTTMTISAKPNSTPIFLLENICQELNVIANNFENDISGLTQNNFFDNIENIIKSRSLELIGKAIELIDKLNPDGSLSDTYGKDGGLYLARLKMRKALKLHSLVQSDFVPIQKTIYYLELIEQFTRCLHPENLPDFTPKSSNIPILITGFDPFTRIQYADYGWDIDGHYSNPSGNIALAFNGKEILHPTDPLKNIYVQSAIFPVRYEEFDKGWIEDFFKQYIDPNHPNFNEHIGINNPVKAIITFSYGVYESGNHPNFNLERFAVRYRDPWKDNNRNEIASESNYLKMSDKDNYEFILSTLPLNIVNEGDKVKFDEKVFYRYSYKNNISTPAVISSVKAKGTRRYTTDNPLPLPDINLQIYAPEENGFPIPSGAIDEKIISHEGSGGNYLSNEIFYRVSFLRETFNQNLVSGHLHVGFLKYDGDRQGDVDRKVMTQIVEKILLEIADSL